ncbi:MAG: stage II sporulation protein M [Anaerovoracaceae bacterium]
MKHLNLANSPIVEQACTLALGSQKTILTSLFIFLTGISTGVFLQLTMTSDENANLAGYLKEYLYSNGVKIDFPNPFFSSVGTNLFLLLIISLCGLSALGFPLALLTLLYKGMSLGFSVSLIMETMSQDGIPLIFTSLVPQNLVLIPVFILATSTAVNFAFEFFHSRSGPLKKNLPGRSSSYLLTEVCFAIAIIIGCGIEAILYPFVLVP